EDEETDPFVTALEPPTPLRRRPNTAATALQQLRDLETEHGPAPHIERNRAPPAPDHLNVARAPADSPQLKWTDRADLVPTFNGEEPLVLSAWLASIKEWFPIGSSWYRFRIPAANRRLRGIAATRMENNNTTEWSVFEKSMHMFFNEKVAMAKAIDAINLGTRYKTFPLLVAIDMARRDYVFFVIGKDQQHMDAPITHALCAAFPPDVILSKELGRGSNVGFEDTTAKLELAITLAAHVDSPATQWARDGLAQAYAATAEAPAPTAPVAEIAMAAAPTAPAAPKKGKSRPRGSRGKRDEIDDLIKTIGELTSALNKSKVFQ
ncbi:hypothetical protein GGI21_005629, partial [Coemansia aciculifera]